MSKFYFGQFFRHFKKKRKVEHDQQAIRKITAVETMIEQKFLVVDHANYQVAMLDNLWTMYDEDKQMTLCENLKFYCDIQNAYKGIEVKKKQNLLISLKNESNEVFPFVYFTRTKIEKYADLES